MNAQEFEYKAHIAKKYADHLRDIDTIIAAKKSTSRTDVSPLEKYKEAVIDLFKEEMKLSN
jgi:hypothetical protein